MTFVVIGALSSFVVIGALRGILTHLAYRVNAKKCDISNINTQF